jgi:putative transposase
MAAIAEAAPSRGIAATCTALGVARGTYYRRRRPKTPKSRRASPRALTSGETSHVLALLHEPRFVDLATPQVYATLLDEGQYLCSQRTMYRILAANTEVRERRDQLRHPDYVKPELLAVVPNQVWSWDITKLLGPAKWTYFYLYVILDIFSRYVVGWMVASKECARLAEELIATTCARQGIGPGQLTLHADRGSSMTSKPVAFLLADLGVTKTDSRPHVSDDNPFSEAQFKTLKYRPDFPERFGSAAHSGRTAKTSSSLGTTPSTGTAESACSRHTTYTMASPPCGSKPAMPSWQPHTPPIRSASRLGRLATEPRPRPSGSTRRSGRCRARRCDTKFFFELSHSC